MADKANQARDKLRALNANLLQKRSDRDRSATMPTASILSQLRQARAEGAGSEVTAAGGEGEEQSTTTTRPKLEREESTLAVLRKEALKDGSSGSMTRPPSLPSFQVSGPEDEGGAPPPASLLDVIQAGSTIKK